MTKTTKKAIFLRNFAWLLSIWLVLMLGFSVYLLHEEKQKMEEDFSTDVQNVVSSLYEFERRKQVVTGETALSLAENVRAVSGYGARAETQNFCFAVYSQGMELVYTSGDTWFSSYMTPVIEGRAAVESSFFYPGKWFDEEEITRLLYYLNYSDETRKVGNLRGYYVKVSGWLDGMELIPERFSVSEQYVVSYTEDSITGSVSSVDSIDTFETDYKNAKDLPYKEAVWIQDGALSYESPEDNELLAAVADEERFRAAEGWTYQTEPSGLFSQQYYMATAYRGVRYNGIPVDYKYWIAAAGESNFLLGIWKPLLAVWVICFGVFFGAAYVLSAQTWQTYRRRAALEQQRKDTTNAIAHDLKTPLAAISGYAENLMHGVHTEKRDYYAGRIFENVRRMDGILQKMLNLSRLDAGVQRLFLETISLRALTEEAMQPYRDALAEKNITLRIQGEGEMAADRGLMLRALDNFLSNAASYTPEGGEILITISARRWSIHNTGAQIPENQLKTIWQAYYKADTARSRPEGSGLGLSIVKAILELHGFAWGAENTGEGVRFWFEL